MVYTDIHKGIFISRPNRFIAEVKLSGEIVRAHVKNTGRCKELLIPGVTVILQKANNPNRVTQYDLFAVWKENRLINMDSHAPNRVFHEYLLSGCYIPDITKIKTEAVYGNSRFDFYVEAGERRIFIEVKGVTLEENNIGLFPDAPTLRGIKHLNELIRCMEEGYEAQVVFIIQMKGVHLFTPNHKTHPQFQDALLHAKKKGVKIMALDCTVTENSMVFGEQVPVVLTHERGF